MRITHRRLAWVAGTLAAAALTPAAGAQGPGPYSVYYLRQRYANVPVVTSIAVATTVTVPDGGTASLGGYSRVSEGRSEFGVRGLGRLPYAGRPLRNVSYGRSTVGGRVTASVRIIDLREEEFRQTGLRSP
jgi:type II secretory pathway component GspD/PulD (secretin)